MIRNKILEYYIIPQFMRNRKIMKSKSGKVVKLKNEKIVIFGKIRDTELHASRQDSE